MTSDSGLPKIDRQHSVPFNRSTWTDSPAVSELVDRLAEELGIVSLSKAGNRKPKTTAKDMLRILVADLFGNWLTDPSLSIGFSKNKTSYKVKSRYNKAGVSSKIIEIVRRLVDAGYLEEIKGFKDKTGKRDSFNSRIRPNDKLRTLFASMDANQYDIDYQKNSELIILREKYTDGEDDKKSRNVEYKDTELTLELRRQLESYNELLRRTFIDIPTLTEPFIRTVIKSGNRKGQEISVSIGPNNKHVHRVFNGTEADNFTKGGRFYGGWWLQVPKEYRPQIYINNKPTVEVDYKALHPSLLMNEPLYDPYDLGELLLPDVLTTLEEQRKVVKGVVLMAINATSANAAFAAFRDDKKKGHPHKALTNRQLQVLLDEVKTRYPELKDALNTGQGLTLMNIDSQIANLVLGFYTKVGIPVLCVHDSFIIEWGREEELKRIMDGASIQIKEKRIAKDAKKNERISKAKLRGKKDAEGNPKIISISTPATVYRTQQYSERLEKHNTWLISHLP